jgi:hypothetical protein
MEKIAASIAQIAAEALLRAGAEGRVQGVDLSTPLLDGLKAWIADQAEPKPTVSEAVRRGLTEWLASQGYPTAGRDAAPRQDAG